MLRNQKYRILLWSICYTIIALRGNVHSSSEPSIGWKAGAAGDEERGNLLTDTGQSNRRSMPKFSSQTEDQKVSTPTISSNFRSNQYQNISNLMYNLEKMHNGVDDLYEIVQAIVMQQNDPSKERPSENDILASVPQKRGSKVDSEIPQEYHNTDLSVEGEKPTNEILETHNTYSDEKMTSTFTDSNPIGRLKPKPTNENIEKPSDLTENGNTTFAGVYETTMPILDNTKPVAYPNLNANHSGSLNSTVIHNASELIFSTEFLGEHKQTESSLGVENVRFQITGGANETQPVTPESALPTYSEIAKSNDLPIFNVQNSSRDVGLERTSLPSSASSDEIALEKTTKAVTLIDSDTLKETSNGGSDEILQKIKKYHSDDSAPPIPVTMYGDKLEEKDEQDLFEYVTASFFPTLNSTSLQNTTSTTSNNGNNSSYFPVAVDKSSLSVEENNSNSLVPGTDHSSAHFQMQMGNRTGFSDKTKQLENENANSTKPSSWKRICFQSVNEIRHTLDDNFIVLPPEKADIYLFYYIPFPKKDEDPILYLSNFQGRKYDGGYLKHRYTKSNDSYADEKYAAFSLQHHKMIASYRQNKFGKRSRKSRNANLETRSQFNSPVIDPRYPYLWTQKNYAQKSVIDWAGDQKSFDLGETRNLESSVRFKKEIQKNNTKKSKAASYYCMYLPFYNETLKGRNTEENITEWVAETNGGRDKRYSVDLHTDKPDGEDGEENDGNNKQFLADLHSDKPPPLVCHPPSKWCADRSKCIAEISWCNNIIDCLDKSDEVHCSCKERMDKDKVCDGYFDCPNGEDEKGCHGCPENMFSCDDWSIRKRNATCVYMSQRCDNNRDCPNEKDERDCEILTETIDSHDLFQTSYTSGYLHRNWKGVWYPACTNANGDEEWALKACTSELGTYVKHVESEILPFFNHYDGQFITRDQTGFIKFVDFCTHPEYAVHVSCPSITCGSRIPHEHFHAKYRSKRSTETKTQDLIDVLKNIIEEQKNFGIANQTRTRRDERIVGGQYSYPGRWPWLIALHKNGNFHCGGAILDETWVVSAAHCVKDHAKHYFEIQAGILRRFSFSPSEQTRVVTHTIMHPQFRSEDMRSDIALLKLNEPLKFNRWVRPACLPEAKPPWGPPAGTMCTAVGWGSITERGRDPDNMKEVTMPILPMCKYKVDRENDQICAGYLAGGRDTCQGDSGGPLLCRIPLTYDRWYVGGVVSHGEGCARPSEPGAYTRIALFLPWLLKNTDDSLLTEARKTKHQCSGTKCVHGGRCISKKRVCDTVIDCLSAEDELDCDQFFQPSTNPLDYNTMPYFFKVSDNETDISSNQSAGYSLSDIKHAMTETKSNKTSSLFRSSEFDDVNLSSFRSQPFMENKNESNNFVCTVFHQIIPKTSYCNGEVDCEDGTDEIDCICIDFLRTYNSSLVCDGVIHCDDWSDEVECSDKNCLKTEFFCYISRTCIDRKLLCDENADCPESEDENACYAVIPPNTEEIETRFDIFERPLFAETGEIAYNEKGVWKWLCLVPKEDDPLYLYLVSHLSEHLGRKLNYVVKKVVFNNTLSSDNKSANTCVGLSVSSWLAMRNDDEVVLPWLANIYVNGQLSCLGVLIIGNWVVADYNCCSSHKISNNDYIVVTLGTMRETSHIIRSYGEEIIVVDKLLYRPQFNVVLLHLTQRVEVTERIKPLFVHTLSTLPRPHERCILTANNLQNSTVYELQLVKNCTFNKRCYTMQNKSKFCSNIESIPSYSVVLCVKHEEIWYLSAYMLSGDTTTCSGNDDILRFDPFPGMQNLDENEKTVLGPPNNCVGYRCLLGNCNPWSQMCDGRMDCRQNEDERKLNCEIYQNIICKFKLKECACQIHEFRCKNGKCVSQTAICDGKTDCPDNSDEPATCSNFTCADYLNLTNPKKLCDARQDCFDKTDEDINVCPSLCNFVSSFHCTRSNICIPMDFVCDGERDCVEGEDEEYCSSLKYTTNNSTVGTLWMQSNGKWRQECLSSDITPFNVNVLCTQFGFDHALHVETEPGSKHISTPFVTLKLNHNVEIVINKKLQNKSPETEQCNYLHLSCGKE